MVDWCVSWRFEDFLVVSMRSMAPKYQVTTASSMVGWLSSEPTEEA